MPPDATTSGQDQSLSREYVVQNRMGIHARPAAMIVRLANRFDCEVYVNKGGDQVNGKSIMGLMMLAAGHGSKLKFTVIGDDGEKLLEEMAGLFERKFEEG